MEVKEGKPEQALGIASDLPDHFTGKALERIGSSKEEIIIASEGAEDLGFLIYRIEGEEAEIAWMGVRKERQRQGIGTLLIERAESSLRDQWIRRIVVRSLDDSVGYEPYSGTNAFYRKMGFVKVRTEDVPGWDPGNLCAVYEMKLTDGRIVPFI